MNSGREHHVNSVRVFFLLNKPNFYQLQIPCMPLRCKAVLVFKTETQICSVAVNSLPGGGVCSGWQSPLVCSGSRQVAQQRWAQNPCCHHCPSKIPSEYAFTQFNVGQNIFGITAFIHMDSRVLLKYGLQ